MKISHTNNLTNFHLWPSCDLIWRLFWWQYLIYCSCKFSTSDNKSLLSKSSNWTSIVTRFNQASTNARAYSYKQARPCICSAVSLSLLRALAYSVSALLRKTSEFDEFFQIFSQQMCNLAKFEELINRRAFE